MKQKSEKLFPIAFWVEVSTGPERIEINCTRITTAKLLKILGGGVYKSKSTDSFEDIIDMELELEIRGI